MFPIRLRPVLIIGILWSLLAGLGCHSLPAGHPVSSRVPTVETLLSAILTQHEDYVTTDLHRLSQTPLTDGRIPLFQTDLGQPRTPLTSLSLLTDLTPADVQTRILTTHPLLQHALHAVLSTSNTSLQNPSDHWRILTHLHPLSWPIATLDHHLDLLALHPDEAQQAAWVLQYVRTRTELLEDGLNTYFTLASLQLAAPTHQHRLDVCHAQLRILEAREEQDHLSTPALTLHRQRCEAFQQEARQASQQLKGSMEHLNTVLGQPFSTLLRTQSFRLAPLPPHRTAPGTVILTSTATGALATQQDWRALWLEEQHLPSAFTHPLLWWTDQAAVPLPLLTAILRQETTAQAQRISSAADRHLLTSRHWRTVTWEHQEATEQLRQALVREQYSSQGSRWDTLQAELHHDTLTLQVNAAERVALLAAISLRLAMGTTPDTLPFLPAHPGPVPPRGLYLRELDTTLTSNNIDLTLDLMQAYQLPHLILVLPPGWRSTYASSVAQLIARAHLRGFQVGIQPGPPSHEPYQTITDQTAWIQEIRTYEDTHEASEQFDRWHFVFSLASFHYWTDDRRGWLDNQFHDTLQGLRQLTQRHHVELGLTLPRDLEIPNDPTVPIGSLLAARADLLSLPSPTATTPEDSLTETSHRQALARQFRRPYWIEFDLQTYKSPLRTTPDSARHTLETLQNVYTETFAKHGEIPGIALDDLEGLKAWILRRPEQQSPASQETQSVPQL